MWLRICFPRTCLRAPKLLAAHVWRPALLIGVAALAVVGTSLPASAAQPDYFGPDIKVNPACLDPNKFFTSKPTVPSYDGAPDIAVTDDDGNDTVSTYVKGSQWCVRADWHFRAVGRGGICRFWFYVPNDVNAFATTGGGADATFVVGFYGPDGKTLIAHSDPIVEADAAGYTPLTISGDPNLSDSLTGINLGDNTGQPAGSAQIGWGIDPENSLKRQCP